MRTKWLSLVTCGVLFLHSYAAHAQLQLTFDTETQTTLPGGMVSFTGTLTNLSNSEVFMNGDIVNLIGSGLTVDDSPFLQNAPLSLTAAGTANSSWTGQLLTISTTPTTPPDYYPGSFAILGGATNGSQDTVATQTFIVHVQPIPAPSALVTALMGAIPGVSLLLRRQTLKSRLKC